MPQLQPSGDLFQSATPPRAGYPRVLETICLEPQWIRHTGLLRYMKVFQCIFNSRPGLEDQCRSGDFVSSVLEQVMLKAYGQRRAHCLLTGRDLFSTLTCFARSPHGGSSAYVGLAFLIMLQHDKPDNIIAKFGELCDRVSRCPSAQKQGYNLLIRHAAQILELSAGECSAGTNNPDFVDDLTTYDSAMRRVHACVEDFLDDFKEKAFKSAIHEPARFYFDAIGDPMGRDHVNVHGLNAYLCMLRGGLGLQLPLIPLEDDAWYHHPEWWGPRQGVLASPWESLTEAAWTQFSCPEHFGIDFEGVKPLWHNKASFVKRRAGRGSLHGDPHSLEQRAAAGDPKLRIYMERFAHFFSREAFVRRMVETLNAENKTEHMGFCKARDVLYGIYQKEVGASEMTFTEHVYDEYFINLDVDRTCKFFQWLGVVKPTPTQDCPVMKQSNISNVVMRLLRGTTAFQAQEPCSAAM